jgi:hypothetical protein
MWVGFRFPAQAFFWASSLSRRHRKQQAAEEKEFCMRYLARCQVDLAVPNGSYTLQVFEGMQVWMIAAALDTRARLVGPTIRALASEAASSHAYVPKVKSDGTQLSDEKVVCFAAYSPYLNALAVLPPQVRHIRPA